MLHLEIKLQWILQLYIFSSMFFNCQQVRCQLHLIINDKKFSSKRREFTKCKLKILQES